jgi:hypothetical protein
MAAISFAFAARHASLLVEGLYYCNFEFESDKVTLISATAAAIVHHSTSKGTVLVVVV